MADRGFASAGWPTGSFRRPANIQKPADRGLPTFLFIQDQWQRLESVPTGAGLPTSTGTCRRRQGLAYADRGLLTSFFIQDFDRGLASEPTGACQHLSDDLNRNQKCQLKMIYNNRVVDYAYPYNLHTNKIDANLKIPCFLNWKMPFDNHAFSSSRIYFRIAAHTATSFAKILLCENLFSHRSIFPCLFHYL